MPTISNLQGNLRLNSGVFEIYQGTGIVPNLYTSSVVNPSSLKTGLYPEIYIEPSGASYRAYLGTGLSVGLVFNNSNDLKYHYQNQYWFLMTGATQNGSFSRYTGYEAIQVNSTGLNINRKAFPNTCFFKAQILPLDLNAKIDKIYNSGTFAVGVNDAINFGAMDEDIYAYSTEKVNINGNLLLRSQNQESYIRIENSLYPVGMEIRSSSPTGAIADYTFVGPNVSIGQFNYIDSSYTGLNGSYQQNNYVFGSNNLLFNSGNKNTSSTKSTINGSSNIIYNSNQITLLGNNSVISTGSDLLLVGSSSTINSSTGNLAIGNATFLNNSNSSIYLGVSNTVATGVRSIQNSMILGRNNSVNKNVSGRHINQSTGFDVNLVGQGNAIFANNFNNINVAGNTNVLVDTGNTIFNINSFGANNTFSRKIQSINNVGLNNTIGPSINTNLFGSNITNVSVTGVTTAGNDNINKDLNTSISLGNSNRFFNTTNSVLVGNSNNLGNDNYTLSGTTITPYSNSILQQNILIGNDSSNYINRSILIGSNSRSVRAQNISGANSILIGDTNFSSGSNNLALGNFTKIYGTGNNISNISVGNNNNLFNTNSSVIVGNNNLSTGNLSNNNSALGLSNTFTNSSNNLALGNGNIFQNESNTLKVNLGSNNLTFNSSGLNLGSSSLRAGNIFLTGASGVSLSQTLTDINNSNAFQYITNKSWHFSTTTFEKTGVYGERIYSIGREVQLDNNNDQLSTPIKLPSTIQIPSTLGRGEFVNTIITGFYDLYFVMLRGGLEEFGIIKATDRNVSYIPYYDNQFGYYEYQQANALVSDNGAPYYYFYGKFNESNSQYSIISYSSPNSNSDLGIWQLYTNITGRANGAGGPAVILLNTYQSGQSAPQDTIPLSNWFGSGNWGNPSSAAYNPSLVSSLTSLSSMPDTQATNIPNIEPVISSQRMKYINVNVPIDGWNAIPGSFLPVYY